MNAVEAPRVGPAGSSDTRRCGRPGSCAPPSTRAAPGRWYGLAGGQRGVSAGGASARGVRRAPGFDGTAAVNPLGSQPAPLGPAGGVRHGTGNVPRLAAMRLLVVEDDPRMAALLMRSLQREGYAVGVVGSGEDALWSVLENDYDGSRPLEWCKSRLGS